MSMRKTCVLLLLLCALGVRSSARAEEVLVNAVVAEVNDRAITLHQVLNAVGKQLAELRTQYTGAQLQKKTAELVSEALRTLIWNALLVHEAERQLSEREKRQAQLTVDRIIKEMIGGAGSLLNLRQKLEQLGLTLEQEKRRQTEKQMVQMLLEREVRQLVSVRARDVRQYYLEHRSELHTPKQVRIRQILVRFTDYESKTEAGKVAGQVREKLRGGGDFAHLAKLYSHGPYAEQGGLWEFMEQGAFIAPVDEAAFSLGRGELSEVIEGPTGCHIIQVQDINPARTVPFAEAQADIQNSLYRQRYQERYRAYVEGLQQRARLFIYQQHLQAGTEHVLLRATPAPGAVLEAPAP